ncbi:MAG TPA: type II toxin-antitoxin system HipA family toxin, partial [Bacteroidales bacterium]|nr:type II toxin-antitoxin system HipA family toxin [Bacteroidales bacterium]
NSLTLDLPLKVLEYFRLNKDDGLIIIDRIRKAVTDWRRIANRYQLPKSEQEIMAKVFERFLKK